jgi:hypothetical protein
MHTVRSILGAALAVATLSAVFVTSSCSNDLESTYITQDRFPASYAQSLCTSLQHCCTENTVTFDYDSCTSGWRQYVTSKFTDSAINFDRKAATSCIALLNSAVDVTCAPAPGSIPDARATCQAIFQGTVPVGGACTSDTDCAAGDGGPTFCSPSGAGGSDAGGTLPLDLPLFEGVCTLGVAPMAGDPCAGGATNPCGTDGTLFCDPGSLTCQMVGAVGDPCDVAASDSCAAGSYCVAVGTGDDACAAAQAVGSPCTDNTQCDATGVCDTAGTMTCIARLGAGTACSSGDQCLSGACDAKLKICLENAIATSAACVGSGP